MRRYLSGIVLAAGLLMVGASSAQDTPARDLAVEEANRALVLTFYDRFFNQHDLDAAHAVADGYRQHNPHVPDGKAPFVSYLFPQQPAVAGAHRAQCGGWRSRLAARAFDEW